MLYSGCALVEDSGSGIGPAGAARPAARDDLDALAADCPKGANDEFAERIDAKPQESGK